MTRAMGKARAKSGMEVHAVNRYYKNHTYCWKNSSEYPTAEGDAVTCAKCQYCWQVAANREAYFQAHPAERGWYWLGGRTKWGNEDGRRMVKTKRKNEYTVSDKDGVIGVAASYEAGCALKREELQPATDDLKETVQATPALNPSAQRLLTDIKAGESRFSASPGEEAVTRD